MRGVRGREEVPVGTGREGGGATVRRAVGRTVEEGWEQGRRRRHATRCLDGNEARVRMEAWS